MLHITFLLIIICLAGRNAKKNNDEVRTLRYSKHDSNQSEFYGQGICNNDNPWPELNLFLTAHISVRDKIPALF